MFTADQRLRLKKEIPGRLELNILDLPKQKRNLTSKEQGNRAPFLLAVNTELGNKTGKPPYNSVRLNYEKHIGLLYILIIPKLDIFIFISR